MKGTFLETELCEIEEVDGLDDAQFGREVERVDEDNLDDLRLALRKHQIEKLNCRKK